MFDYIFNGLLGITDYLDHSTLVSLTIIFTRMVKSLWNGFNNLHVLLKIITFMPFVIYLCIGTILILVSFSTSVITFIPFLINRIGNMILSLTINLAGDGYYNEYNFFQIILFPLLIYTAVFLALIFLIVPGIAINQSIGGIN